MTEFENEYASKSRAELIELLKMESSLILPAKLALQNIVSHKFEDEEITILLQGLNRSIDEEHDNINNLKYLGDYGFSLKKELNSISLVRSQNTYSYNRQGLILSIILIIISIPSSVEAYYQISVNAGFSLFFLIGLIGSLLGVFGLLLFVRVLIRIFVYKGFKVVKDKSNVNIALTQDLNFRKFQFSNQAIFDLKEEGQEFSVDLTDGERRLRVLTLNSGGYKKSKTFSSLVLHLNSKLVM